MFTPIDKEQLLKQIESTQLEWKSYANREELYAFDFSAGYPLCLFIRSCVKYQFTKGDISNTCGYCPIHYFGYSYLCTAFNQFDTRDELVANNSFLLIHRAFGEALDVINSTLAHSEVAFTEYSDYIITKKQRLSNAKIVPNAYTPPVKKPKILKPKYRM